jgi:hypothetical protein
MVNFSRKLGLVEHLFETFHSMGAMIYVNIARVQGFVAVDVLRTAIDLLQKRHPLLQVHLQELDSSFYFCADGTVAIPLKIIDRQHDRQWLEIAEDELSQKFAGEFEPLCRITLLQSPEQLDRYELIVTFHHAIADGISALHFMHELLSFCQQLEAGTPISSMESLPLLPPLEQLLEKFLLEPDRVTPSQTSPPPALLIEQTAPVDLRQTRLIPHEFDRELTLQLKSRCRDEQTTVHGALCAAMLLAYTRQLSSPEPVLASCGSNVNLRGSCIPVVESSHLGCFVAAVTTVHQISLDANFWELARECQTTIHQLIDDKVPHHQVSNPDLVNKYQPSFLAQLAAHNMGRTTTTHVSNLGQFDFTKSSGSVRLESFHFATGQHLVGTGFWLGAVTIDRKLCCTFTYIDPLISKNTAKLLANSAISILNNVSFPDGKATLTG